MSISSPVSSPVSSQQGWSLPRRFALVALALVIGIPLAAHARQVQQLPSGNTARPQPPNGALEDPHEHDPFAAQNSSKMEHMREDDRRKRLLADTARLVALSNELKTEVDNTTRDELSIEVIRKATEIEKLAHDVRERMKS